MSSFVLFLVVAFGVLYLRRLLRSRRRPRRHSASASSSVCRQSFFGTRSECVQFCCSFFDRYPEHLYASRTLSPPRLVWWSLGRRYRIEVERLSSARPAAGESGGRGSPDSTARRAHETP